MVNVNNFVNGILYYREKLDDILITNGEDGLNNICDRAVFL